MKSRKLAINIDHIFFRTEEINEKTLNIVWKDKKNFLKKWFKEELLYLNKEKKKLFFSGKN